MSVEFKRNFNAFGFEDLFRELENSMSLSTDKYPPYNILKSQTTNGILYILEMALAGFSKEDIDVYVEGASSRKLVISVKSKTEENTNSQFLVRGLSFRSFVRKFDLTPNVEVQKVKLENGILKVELLDKKTEPKKQSFDIE